MKRAINIACGIMGILMVLECVYALYGFGKNMYWNLTYIADYLFDHDTTILPYYSIRVILQIPLSLLGVVQSILGILAFVRYHEWKTIRTLARLWAAVVVIGLLADIMYAIFFVPLLFQLLILAFFYALTWMCRKLQDSLKDYPVLPFIHIMGQK